MTIAKSQVLLGYYNMKIYLLRGINLWWGDKNLVGGFSKWWENEQIFGCWGGLPPHPPNKENHA